MYDRGFVNENRDGLSERRHPIYSTEGDTRDEFFRDYTRILHSNAYRRLKHKTQVFYNINNDHICTRMEHVSHVEAVSHSIALGLDLDPELTRAIACGHDLGHAPFGHHGENVLSKIMEDHLSPEYKKTLRLNDGDKLFWHERNGLRFVDDIELLPDPHGIRKNLNLTYAVRDGIISHCGEIDVNGLCPRNELIDLDDYKKVGQYSPASWEGCVVKISDKIAYLGRDIEDAVTLHFLSEESLAELKALGEKYCGRGVLNTSSIMHEMIGDICRNSTPGKGITLGDEKYELLCRIKEFNYKYIYLNERFHSYLRYAGMVLEELFRVLHAMYRGEDTVAGLLDEYKQLYPKLTREFTEWLATYCDPALIPAQMRSVDTAEIENHKIYAKLENEDLYVQAIVDFLSGMTDAYAVSVFNELLTFA
ncbi:MAG: HD domain-containing protein [Lachnospiraceae bacterium]|nr:HD domain-containing protein [Lachnospiraceae bacterium]